MGENEFEDGVGGITCICIWFVDDPYLQSGQNRGAKGLPKGGRTADSPRRQESPTYNGHNGRTYQHAQPTPAQRIITPIPYHRANHFSMHSLRKYVTYDPDVIIVRCLSLEKKTSKKCLTIGARELGIAWSETPQYWQWRSDYGSRFPEVAELIHVCWLDINGKIETQMLSPKTTYIVYLVIKHTDSTYGIENPYSVDVSVSFSGGGTASGSRKVYLERSPGPRAHRYGLRPRLNPVQGAFPTERRDGWMEIELGEFYNDLGEDGEVHVCVQEVKQLHWKRGLIVEGIEFRPLQLSNVSPIVYV